MTISSKKEKRKGKWFAHKQREVQGPQWPSVDPTLLLKVREKTQIGYFGTSHVSFDFVRGEKEQVTELLFTLSVSLSWAWCGFQARFDAPQGHGAL